MSKERPLYLRKTYCNPLPMPNCPRGTDECGWKIMTYTNEEPQDYRSISDPSVLYYDNKWYLYPSYGMSYVSEDFCHFRFVKSEPYDMGYSPTVIPHRGKFLMTSHSHGLYIGETPTGPFTYLGDFILPDGSTLAPVDPALFVDDDGRIYLYWFFGSTPDEHGVFTASSLGVELDPDDPRVFLSEPHVICSFDKNNKWEYCGADNQDNTFGWIEGQWMVKHNGRYYFIYAAPATQFKSYCMAAYYSDEGPLSGFICQKNNPVTEHRGGIVSGAGHGSIAHGPDNSLYAFFTVTHPAVHPFERRIGMAPIGVDENGELYCPGVSDRPQFAYGETENYLDADCDLLPLTFMNRHKVCGSSAAPGRGAIYAFDESTITWWQPTEDDRAPTLSVDLSALYTVEAVRIMWRDIGLAYDSGAIPGAYQYVVEGRRATGEGEWITLLDAGDNCEDYTVDYRTFPPQDVREVRLRILGGPANITPGVTSFTAFGTRTPYDEV